MLENDAVKFIVLRMLGLVGIESLRVFWAPKFPLDRYAPVIDRYTPVDRLL